MIRHNPFKRNRFPRQVILLAVRWHCGYPLSCRDVQDLRAERGITVEASTVNGACGSLAPKSGNGPTPSTAPGADCDGMSMRPNFVWAGFAVTFGVRWISSAS